MVEAARLCKDARPVRAMVAEAVQDGQCTVQDLVRELQAAPRAGTALLRRAVDEAVAGVRSVAEGDARKILAGSAVLPALLWNPRLTTPGGAALPTPDRVESRKWTWRWRSTRGRITCHRRTGGRTPCRRHRKLTEAGALVLHFSPRQIRESPAAFVKSVERAYLTRLAADYRTRIHATAR